MKPTENPWQRKNHEGKAGFPILAARAQHLGLPEAMTILRD
jgi:hypothetical protein